VVPEFWRRPKFGASDLMAPLGGWVVRALGRFRCLVRRLQEPPGVVPESSCWGGARVFLPAEVVR